MPIDTKLASQAAGARLLDIAQAARIVDTVVASAPVINNNKTLDEFELKKALKGQSPEVKAAAMAAYHSAKNAADAKGKLVTRWDVSKRLDEALAAAEKADKDQDGELSEQELSSLKNWTPLRLAAVAVTLEQPDTGKMSSAELAKAATKIMTGVLVMSEGDSPVTGIVSKKSSASITPDTILEVFSKQLDEVYGEYPPENGLVAEVSSNAKAKKILNDSTKVDTEADDAKAAELDANAYANLKALFASNLTDLRFVRIGPAEEDGSMGVDQGTYVEMFVGKTSDGKLAGVMWTSAET